MMPLVRRDGAPFLLGEVLGHGDGGPGSGGPTHHLNEILHPMPPDSENYSPGTQHLSN